MNPNLETQLCRVCDKEFLTGRTVDEISDESEDHWAKNYWHNFCDDCLDKYDAEERESISKTYVQGIVQTFFLELDS